MRSFLQWMMILGAVVLLVVYSFYRDHRDIQRAKKQNGEGGGSAEEVR